MIRRVAAVGMLSVAALVFAVRFQPPPSGTFGGAADDFVVVTQPAVTTTTISPQATTPHVRPTTTTTIATRGPGVQIVTGPMIQMNRGFVQVEVTVIDGLVADVQMIVVPSESRRAREVSIDAARYLRIEAIENQTYRLHNVSGATETAGAYRQSLKGALIEAGVVLTET